MSPTKGIGGESFRPIEPIGKAPVKPRETVPTTISQIPTDKVDISSIEGYMKQHDIVDFNPKEVPFTLNSPLNPTDIVNVSGQSILKSVAKDPFTGKDVYQDNRGNLVIFGEE